MAKQTTAQQLESGVSLREITTITPYARNSRTHSPEQIAAIAASIDEFGFVGSIVVMDGTIAKGHGTLAAVQQLIAAGKDVYPAPGRRSGVDPFPAGLIPVQDCSGWSDEQFRAFVIADNRLAESAGWDRDMLALEVSDLGAMEFDLSLLGFDPGELDGMLAGDGADVELPEDTEPQVDRAEELRAKWGVEPGQLWQLGDHRLLCGDSTRADHVALLLGDDVPHLMVTDPPYGVEYDADWRNHALRSDGSPSDGRAVGKVENDDRADWRDAWALFPGDAAYVWHAMKTQHSVAESIIGAGFDIRAEIVWAKNQMVISRGDYHPKHESCFYAVRKGKTGHWQGDRTQTTLWQIDKPKKSETGHSTQKPIECMARPIENNSAHGELVYEPFSGSGTTIIAGENLGRRVRAIEISPAYVAVALQRWADHTGKTPMLLS